MLVTNFSRIIILCVVLASNASPAAAESCHSHDLSGVGHCHENRYARNVVRTQLMGMAQAQQQTPPSSMNTTLLATQLTGELATGVVYPVANSAGHDWVMLTYPASVAPDASRYSYYSLSTSHADDNPALLAVIHWTQPAGKADDDKPTATVLAMSSDALIPGQTKDDSSNDSAAKSPSKKPLACVVPKSESEGSDPGVYSSYAQFRWLQLSAQHRVLAATLTRNEGYAGGGGSFSAELLLDISADGELSPIACYAVNSYQMIAGEWNQDGTRQHEEYQSGWKLVIAHGSRQAWPQLRLVPTTNSTSGATLVWDAQAQHYVESVKRQ
ncbi:hypothetical protein [Paraburkholderia bannensis]|uniref:hypothetical protein n=1 Tax=Paraburkholderia bannensis TaxID=765414 RepID=UPI002AB63E0F|nr:hypothetical protein [Paraburkholderia bannensis]